ISDKEAADAESRREQEEEERLLRAARSKSRAKRAVVEADAATRAGRQRRANVQAGKPINAGVRYSENVPPVPTASAPSVVLHVAYYHGFLTLEAESKDPASNVLKKWGFKH